jgi:drug/metabolite transporter (DMT)-like permease
MDFKNSIRLKTLRTPISLYSRNPNLFYFCHQFMHTTGIGISDKTRAYTYMHVAVVLFGFTAILGDLVILSALVLVWWRVFLTSGSLLLFFKRADIQSIYNHPKFWRITGVGVIVALHWLCFYGSVKAANASIALVCMSTTSVFTSFIEPFLHKTSIRKQDVFLGFLMIPCFVLVAGYIPDQYSSGVLLGLGAAVLAALFSVLNKKYVNGHNVYAFTFIELGTACIFLGICLAIVTGLRLYPTDSLVPQGLEQWLYVFILSFLCTTLAYVLSLKALRHITAFASNMIINLEPVYGIILAIIILGEKEHMHWTFYLGALFITVIVFMYPWFTRQKQST